MVSGQILQGHQYIFADEIALIVLHEVLYFIDHHSRGSHFQGLCGKVIRIEIRSFQRKKEVARIDLAGIGTYACTFQKERVEDVEVHFSGKFATK